MAFRRGSRAVTLKERVNNNFIFSCSLFYRFCVEILPVCEKVIVNGMDDSSLTKEKNSAVD